MYNCNSLFTCFLSHQVFIFTHMLSVHFSAFCMHYPRFNTLPLRTRNCRLLQRHCRDVALAPGRITDITLSRMTLAPAAVFCRGIGTRSRQRRSKGRKGQTSWVHTYPTVSSRPRGEMCAKFGSDWFRSVNLYKVQTNKQKQNNFQFYIEDNAL